MNWLQSFPIRHHNSSMSCSSDLLSVPNNFYLLPAPPRSVNFKLNVSLRMKCLW